MCSLLNDVRKEQCIQCNEMTEFFLNFFLFCTQAQGGGGENPLTIHEVYAALTSSDSRSNWASEFVAA